MVGKTAAENGMAFTIVTVTLASDSMTFGVVTVALATGGVGAAWGFGYAFGVTRQVCCSMVLAETWILALTAILWSDICADEQNSIATNTTTKRFWLGAAGASFCEK